jgi:hypothetical protein
VIVPEHVADPAQRTAELVYQQASCLWGVWIPVRPREDEVIRRGLHRLDEKGAKPGDDENGPRLIVLRDRLRPGAPDRQRTRLEVDVVLPETEDLTRASPGIEHGRGCPAPWGAQGRGGERVEERTHLLAPEDIVSPLRHLAALHPRDRVLASPEPDLGIASVLEHDMNAAAEMVEALRPELVAPLLVGKKGVELIREGACSCWRKHERSEAREVLHEEEPEVFRGRAATTTALSLPPPIPELTEGDALGGGL